MQTPDKQRRVIVVGGGITGLSAAWALQQAGVPYTLLEGDERWGGKMVSATLTIDGQQFIIDGGPESFITRKPEVWELAGELGIRDQLIAPAGETSGMYVLFDGTPHRVPMHPAAFLTSRLLTPAGKVRLLLEPFIPARRDHEDESLAGFVRRRLGHEALERLVGPVLGGIYNTDPEVQSILISSPVMREMERDHGGLFAAALAKMRERGRQVKAARARGETLPPRFVTFADGAGRLVEALIDQLHGDLRLNAPVTTITPDADGYRVQLADGTIVTGDAVIITTTATIAADLLGTIAPDAAAQLAAIPHTNLGTLSLVYRTADIPPDLDIRGLMIPRRENRSIDAITRTSARVPNRAPHGYELFRVFFGGAQPDMATRPEAALVAEVRRELRGLLGIDAEPLAYKAFRWVQGYPQAAVGHPARVAAIQAALPDGVLLAGAAYEGVGVPDCIRQGTAAARQAVDHVYTDHVYTNDALGIDYSTRKETV